MHLSRLRPRFTVRWLMVAVAIFALIVWAGLLARRSYEAFKIADLYQTEAIDSTKLEQIYSKKVKDTLNSITEYAEQTARKNEELKQVPGIEKKSYDSIMEVRKSIRNMEASILSHEQDELTRASVLRRYYELLEMKYRRAAWYPWLPIEPDPPYPQ